MFSSNNPVLSKAKTFQPGPTYQAPADSSFGQPANGLPGYGQPTYGQYPNQPEYSYGPDSNQRPVQLPVASQVMTIDDVIIKSAVVLGVIIAVAALTMTFLPIGLLLPTTIITGLVAFGTVLLVSFRRAVNPAFVMAYAAIEGVFLGAISKVFEFNYPGIVMPAVLGTFVTAGVTLAAYHFLRIRVTSKFRQMVFIGTMSIAGVYLVNFVLLLCGIDVGITHVGSGPGMLAILFSLVGVGLAVFNLILDFDVIENGVRNQAPATESWRAAFGLAVTMVWLYTQLLRILSYFRN